MSGDHWAEMPHDILNAKLEFIQAQTIGQQQDNLLAASIAETSQMALRREREKNQWDLAAPHYRRVFYFTGEIGVDSAQNAIDTLSRWRHIDLESDEPNKPYTLVLSSPGGEIAAGFQLYSFLCSIARERELTVVATGLCASMATIIHQAASEGRRFIEPGTTYLLHELSAQAAGRIDGIKDTTDYLVKLNDHLRDVYIDRGIKKTKEELQAEVERRECYLTPAEVLEWGLADEMRFVNGVVPA